MAIKYSNNAKTTVSAAGITGTTINVADASTFPVIDLADDYTYITLLAGSTAQIFKAITIDHANNVILVEVAPDSAVFVPNTTRVELRLTAELLSGLMDTHEHALDDITGVDLSTPAQDQVLTWNGAAWTNAAPTGSGTNTATSTVFDGGDATGTFAGVTVTAASSGGSGQGVTVYPDAAALALATLVTGAMAYVQDIDKLLLCTGTAWSSVAISNEPPTVSFSATAINTHYQEPSWVGYSDITVTAVDPDGVTPTITIESNTLGNGATVEVIGNTLVRVTPNQTYEYDGGSFVIKVTDGETIILQTITVDYAYTNNVIGQATIYNSGNWTVPDGVRFISYFLIGGGAGGAGSANNVNPYSDWVGSDGGDGGKTHGLVDLQAYGIASGGLISIVVGGGGYGGRPTISGSVITNKHSSPGEDTSFGSIATVAGALGNNSYGSTQNGPNGTSYLHVTQSANSQSWQTSPRAGEGGAQPGAAPSPAPQTLRGGSGTKGLVRLIWGAIAGQQRVFGTSTSNTYAIEDRDANGNII